MKIVRVETLITMQAVEPDTWTDVTSHLAEEDNDLTRLERIGQWVRMGQTIRVTFDK